MKRIEKLQHQLQEFEAKVNTYQKRRAFIIQKINECLEKEMKSFFLHGDDDTVTIRNCTESGFDLYLPHQDSQIGREAVSIRFDVEDWRSDKIDGVRASFYTTNEVSKFELERMVLIGRVGAILINQQDEIVDSVNEILSSKRDEIETCDKEIYGTRKKTESIRKEIVDIQQQELIERLETEGLMLQEDEGVSFDAKFDLTFLNVKELQILRKSASGKSADVRVTYRPRSWRGYVLAERTEVVDRVRMDNIVRFVNIYKDRVTV